MFRVPFRSVGLACIVCLILVDALQAQITADQRKELLSLSREVPKAATHIRKKEYDEARKILDDIQAKVDEIAKAANVPATDRAFSALMSAMEKQRALLDKMQGTGDAAPVAFVKDVAPIIQERCIRCHGADNPRNGLRLDTFAGWKVGGKGGPLLVPGASARSLIIARLSAPMDQGRMPPNGEALTPEEIKKIGNWINQGAKFDGEAENMVLGDLIYQMAIKSEGIKLPKATGKETVSFTRDIAPWFSNLCLRCHNENRKNGGLSLATFFDMMRGGESGAVIIPGDMENSRLFRLVGGLENPRMPADNQVRITRQNYEDLKTWFREGNTYDGADFRTSISTFTATDAEMEANKFGSMTAEDFLSYRTKRSHDQFKQAVPNDELHEVATDRFLILGNVSPTRLEQVKTWADTQLDGLQKMFSDKTAMPWRGRLAIFVMKDRFSYDEFVQVVEKRRAAADMNAHSLVSANQEDAYVVLLDLGDDATANQPNLHISVIDQLGGAYVKRSGGNPPQWLVRGLGLSLASVSYPKNPYFHGLEQTAKSLAPTVSSPEDVFRDGSFSPGSIGAVGYSLTEYLLKSAGPVKLGTVLQEVNQGKGIEPALQGAYGVPCAEIAEAYFAHLKK